MDLFVYIITSSVQLFISAMMLLLFARVLLGFIFEEESPIEVFCCVVTEPVIYPVRALLSRIPALQEFPIDISFMATYLLLMIIQLLLPV